MFRAKAFIRQALGRLDELEAHLATAAAGGADWAAVRALGVSLRRNLESAAAELEGIAPGAKP